MIQFSQISHLRSFCEKGGDGMYKVAVCEDEPYTLEQTGSLCDEILNESAVEHEISLFTSAEALEAVIAETGDSFQLIILDIQLDGKSGLTLAKEIYSRNSDIGIVFMTNHREYAEEGYDAHPIHFLTKPIDRARLTEAIKIGLKRKSLPQTITLNYGRKIAVLSIKDIDYIESRNHHICIHKANEVQEIRLPLSEVEAMLSTQFQRCHASYLVNLSTVREVGKSEVILQGGTRLPLSRSYRERFATAYLRYFNTYLS